MADEGKGDYHQKNQEGYAQQDQPFGTAV